MEDTCHVALLYLGERGQGYEDRTFKNISPYIMHDIQQRRYVRSCSELEKDLHKHYSGMPFIGW